ncbi:MAG: hypothetical protein ABSB59_00670 [Streptosporangiaceae bacterium]|jgi:hypothetical protein
MTNSDRQGQILTVLAGCDIDALVFVAEMYAVQLDQLAVVLGVPVDRARGVAARWRSLGLAESARLGPGPPWVWVTRPGLAACGLRYPAAPPDLTRLAHTRAVASVRLALQATTAYRRARASWRGERCIRSDGRGGDRGHLPDGELHWPPGAAVSWAGECWAIQVELTRTTAAGTAGIMRDLLTRLGHGGDQGPAAAWAGLRPQYARALYLCSPAALPAAAEAREALGRAGARIEIRDLPAGAALPPAPAGPVRPVPGEPPARVAPPRLVPS